MPDAPKTNLTASDTIPGVAFYAGRAKAWLLLTARVALLGSLAGGLIALVVSGLWPSVTSGMEPWQSALVGGVLGALALATVPAVACLWWIFLYAVAEVARAIRSP